MNKDSIIDFTGYWAVKALLFILRFIPVDLALLLGRGAGTLAYYLNSKRRSIAYANIKSAFPEKAPQEIKRIVKSHYRHLGMCGVELLKLPSLGTGYIDSHITIHNIERIKEAQEKGRGAILLTAHFGNWEMAPLAVMSRGYRIHVFAREQKLKRLNELLNQYRESSGCNVVRKGFSIRELIKVLKDGEIAAMLIDQDAGYNGRFIDFFNRPASTATGAFTISLRAGAVVLPALIRRDDYRNHTGEVLEPIYPELYGDTEEAMDRFLADINAILESFIRKYPDQWLWSHKRWKSTPHRKVLVLNDGKAGHLNQSLGVAKMVERALFDRLREKGISRPPMVDIEIIDVTFKSRFTRSALGVLSLFAGKRCQGCMRCPLTCLTKETFGKIKNKYADIIISCGSSLAPLAVFLKYENNAKAIYIMKPPPGLLNKFDIVIMPHHDAASIPAGNVVLTDIAPGLVAEESGLPACGNDIGLLIGGDAKGFRLEKGCVDSVLEGILKAAVEMDRKIAVTTSRRTPPEVEEFLKARLAHNIYCGSLVIANEKNPPDTVKGILSRSELVVVSQDSISMISEAVSSGRYVVVFTGDKKRVPGGLKYDRAVERLWQKGLIYISQASSIYECIKRLLTERPGIRTPDDSKWIIEKIKQLL